MKIVIRSVLVSDAVDPLCVSLLQEHGIKVTCKYKLPKEQLIEELQSVDALIVRSDTKVTKEVINSAPGLRVVGRAGTGVDNIDLQAATKRGIVVINTPGGNSISACELTCTLICSLARNVPQACQSLKEGRWDRKLYTGNELQGKTLAVLGLGRIGREVATRMQAFGMKTVGFDPIVTAEQAQSFNVQKMELNEIWPVADYITVHTPLIPATRDLINKTTLDKCKKGVCIINVARGGIINEAALLAALKDGQCGGAALDVFEQEPPTNDITKDLIAHPLVIATPHLGASTEEAQQRVAVEVSEQFIAISGNNRADEKFTVTGAVNAPALAATMNEENLPWIELTQRLGDLLSRLPRAIQSTPSDPSKLTLTTRGNLLGDKNFLSVAALAGNLTPSSPNVNLINAPGLAEDKGLTIQREHEQNQSNNEVSIGDGFNTVTGTLGANKSPVLLRINHATFSTEVGLRGFNTVAIAKNIDLPSLLSEVQQSNGVVTNLALSLGGASAPDIAVVTTTDPIKPLNTLKFAN